MTRKKYVSGIASRANILMAARLCFAQHGFFDTTIQSIETAAQTSRGVIYHHFASKDEMILAIIAENLGNAADKIDSDLRQLRESGKGDLPQLLLSMLEVVEQITFGPGKAMSLHVWSLSLLRPEVKNTMMGFFDRIRGLLKEQIIELQQRGKISLNAEPDKLAAALFSIQIPAYIVQRLFTGDAALDPQEYVRSLVSLFEKT